jgi:surface protein
MFEACGQLKSLDLSSFATRQVTDMSSMFFNCYSLKTVYVKEDYYYWETSNVKISENMFLGCISIVGGGGTTYDANNIDKAYARIDAAPRSPGYFTAKPAFLLGDVNGDGDVNVADVTALVNIVNNVQIENGQWIMDAADVDGSGEVTSADVPALVNKILGK